MAYGGIKMYLFRAINENEEQILNRNGEITAQQIQNTGFMDSAAQHVRAGSKASQKDCWISTTKDFEICASEFAIPQMGGYNTAKKEKNIIVIDAMGWRKYCEDYINNGNYTIFWNNNKQISIDLGDVNIYPISVKQGNRYVLPNGGTVNEKVIQSQVDSFSNAISGGADTGLLDLSFVTDNDRGHKGVINQFSLLEYIKRALTSNCQAPAIASGSAKAAMEVLVLNYIPRDFIKHRLTKLETTVLFALKDAFEAQMKRIIDGDLMIDYQGQEIMVRINGNEETTIKLSRQQYFIMTMFLVDLACMLCTEKENIEQKFEELKKEKREIIKKILEAIGVTIDTVHLQDDEVYVKQIDFENLNEVKENTHDILAVQDKSTGKIMCYRDDDYQALLDKKVQRI